MRCALGLCVLILGVTTLCSQSETTPRRNPITTPVAIPGTTLPVIEYQVPQKGRASLAIYDRQGRLVRTLHTGTPHAAGKHSATWDGLDRQGRSLPAGEYTWKLVATPGLRAEFITQIGQNVDPAWERATGNHEAPIGAALDATGLYRIGATNEGGHYAVKTDLDGKHLWTCDRWSADPWAQGTVAVTLVGERLFELLPNGDLYGYDAKTGRVFTGGNHDPKPWNLGWNGYTAPAGLKDEERRKRRGQECPRDLAADLTNDLVVAAYPQHDGVSWFAAKDGKRIDTATGIKELAGIACDSKGAVFAISGGAVVRFTREHKEPSVVIAADQLRHPWRLAIDPRSGDLLVAENSHKKPGASPHHQVKRFSARGKLLRAYGKPEGRGDGAYVPTDFRGLTDIEATSDGGFLVTEGNHTPPRRTAKFDSEGKLQREWLGAQHYGVIACPEPTNPRFVWTLANAPQQGLIRWEVDYEKKSWRVAEVYQDVFAANPHAVVPQVPDVFERAGRIYIQGGSLQPTALALVEYDPKAKRLRPVAASGERDKKVYLWCDHNDDGKDSNDEITWLKGAPLGGWVDPETLTVWTTPTPTRFTAGNRHAPARITAGGTPVYSEKPTGTVPSVKLGTRRYYPSDYRRAPAGTLYGCFSEAAENPNEGSENHGAWYYNSCSAIDRLLKWDKEGNLLWSVGRHSPDNDHETGSTAMARGLVGLTHDCVIWGDASDEETARPTVWTADGLYVDELLRVPTDFTPKEAYGMFNANEYPCGRLHADAKTGEVLYFALNSGGGAPIYRITGWNGWHRQEGTVTLKQSPPRMAKLDGTGITGEYFNTPDCTGKPALTRTDKLIYFNWGKGTPDKAITAKRFSVRWSGQYEAATNEEVRFEVRGSFPWRDRGKPTFTRLWLNGQRLINSKTETNTVRVRLTAGQRVDLVLECGFQTGEAAVALSHDTRGLDRRAILPEYWPPKTQGEKTAIAVATDRRPALLAGFDFEEKQGALAWSTAGGDVFGRLTGQARRVPGKVGQGLELTGRGEFAPARFPIDEELRLPDTEYAVAFWFRTKEANLPLCEARRYSSYNNRWSDHVVRLEGGKLQFRLQGDAPLSTETPVHDDTWRHVVTTVGPGGQRLYLDGKLVATGKRTRRTTTSNRLGLDLGPGEGTGTVTLDEVQILGRVPTEAEIAAMVRVGKP